VFWSRDPDGQHIRRQLELLVPGINGTDFASSIRNAT